MIAGPLYDDEGIVVADCDLREGCGPSATSTSSGHYGRADVLA